MNEEHNIFSKMKSKKRVWISCILAAVILITAILFILIDFRNHKQKEGEPVLTPTPAPTSFSAQFNLFSTSPLKTPSPLPTPKETVGETPTATPSPFPQMQYIALNELTYDDGRILRYEYTENFVRAFDADDNPVLKLEFDQNGKLIRKTEYHSSFGKYSERVRTWEMDEKGNIVKIYTAGIGPATQAHYQYDDQGGLVSAAVYYGHPETSTFIYDASGAPVTQREIHQNGSVSEYTYGENGKIIREKLYGDSGSAAKLICEVQFEYDQDTIIKTVQKYYDSEGTAVEYTREENYDPEGNVTKILFKRKDGRIIKRSYEYDENGRCILEESANEASCKRMYTIRLGNQKANSHDATYYFDFELDGKGKPLYRYDKDETGHYLICDINNNWILGVRYEDEYDAKGNLTKRTYYDEYDESDNYYYCEYDAQNRKIKEYHYRNECCGDYTYFFNFTYEYDADGAVKRIENEGQYRKEEYLFDTAGHITEYTSEKISVKFKYSAKGKVIGRKLSFIDTNFSVTKEYDENGTVTVNRKRIGNTECISDKNGRKIGEITYGTEGDVQTTRSFTYNTAGKLQKIIECDSIGGILSETEYQYDQNAVLTGWVKYNAQKEVLFKYQNKYMFENASVSTGAGLQGTVEYDQNGNLIRLETYDGRGKKIDGVFQETSKEVYNFYLKCSIVDLLPIEW